MKATMSRDGERRATLRLSVRVDLDDIARALVASYRFDRADLPKSRASAEKLVREAILGRGLDALEFIAGDEEDYDEKFDAARELVGRLWGAEFEAAT